MLSSLYFRIPDREYRLPFHLLLGNLPEVPVEIWERIIDCIKNYPSPNTKDLCTCTLVCRSWYPRAKLRLYEDVDLYDYRVPIFQTAARRYLNLPLASTKKIFVDCKIRPISGFLTINKFKDLKSLSINNLDLGKEHLPVTRGPIFRTVTHLNLAAIHSCKVSNILRFINSFRSLTELDLLCPTPKLFHHKGGVLSPSRSAASVPRLRRLNLWVVSGVGELIKWYIQERHFLKNLEVLTLVSDVRYAQPSPEYHAYIDGCTALLRHCTESLKDLKFGEILPKGSPLVDEAIKIGKLLYTNKCELR